MIEIVAAVVSVSLAAIIGVKIAGYRNLITYEITTISQSLAVHENQIVPSEFSGYCTRNAHLCSLAKRS